MPASLVWEPPDNGTFNKLNVNGSKRVTSGCVGVVDVIRDALGDWVGGFAVNLGSLFWA